MSHLKNLQNLDKELAAAVEMVVKVYGVDPKTIMSNRQDRIASQARFAVWYILFTTYNRSSALIADIFDKDHTTVLHGIQRAKDLKIPTEIDNHFSGQPVEKTKSRGDKKVDKV